jgi:hypothetical protein
MSVCVLKCDHADNFRLAIWHIFDNYSPHGIRKTAVLYVVGVPPPIPAMDTSQLVSHITLNITRHVSLYGLYPGLHTDERCPV